MNVLVFSLYISLFFFIIISFLDFMSRKAVIWISSPELSYICHTYAMPICVLCGPKIRNKDSCILYLRMSAISP